MLPVQPIRAEAEKRPLHSAAAPVRAQPLPGHSPLVPLPVPERRALTPRALLERKWVELQQVVAVQLPGRSLGQE